MKPFLGAVVALLCLFLCLLADASEGFHASENGNNLQVTTPYGSRLYLGDIGFDQLENYRVEIPLKDLRPVAPSGSPGGATPSPSEKAAGMEDEDQLVLEANRLYNQGKFRESLSYVEEILRRNPAQVRAWMMKGSLMHVMGQKDLARKAWGEAQRLKPDDPKIKNLLENYK